jgi:hypothetical protein
MSRRPYQRDLSKITVDVKGEIELKITVNGWWISGLLRVGGHAVARKWGLKELAAADVKGVAGTWKDLTDSVNFMASNLTALVRNIANDHCRGRIVQNHRRCQGDPELKNTINAMVDQLRSFAVKDARGA